MTTKEQAAEEYVKENLSKWSSVTMQDTFIAGYNFHASQSNVKIKELEAYIEKLQGGRFNEKYLDNVIRSYIPSAMSDDLPLPDKPKEG